MKPARHSPKIIRAFFSALLLLGAVGLPSLTGQSSAPGADNNAAQVMAPGDGRVHLAGIVIGDRSVRNSSARAWAAAGGITL